MYYILKCIYLYQECQTQPKSWIQPGEPVGFGMILCSAGGMQAGLVVNAAHSKGGQHRAHTARIAPLPGSSVA